MSKPDALEEGRAEGAGAQSRLDQLYRRYSPWLTARLRGRYGVEAEDIVQDAWIRLAPAGATLEVRFPKAFLLTLASNIAMSRARRDRRRSEILDAEAPTQARAQSPDQIDAVLLEEIILVLPQPLRDVFVLSRITGMSTVQISEALGISPESAYQPEVCSPAGACGLTQLMPGTARDLRVSDRLDPAENLRGGADYLARQIVRFGDLRLALAAYNAGPGRVARLGRAPDIAETRAYVVAVIECYLALTAARGVRNARQCRPQEPTP